MNLAETIGYVAAACTTFAFVPQALQVLKTKDTSSISLSMYVVFTFGVMAWLAFGLLQKSWPVIIANAVTLVFAALLLVLKIRYK